MEIYWVPGVNHLGTYGRWAFAEATEVYQIDADFKAGIEAEFNKMIESALGGASEPEAARRLAGLAGSEASLDLNGRRRPQPA